MDSSQERRLHKRYDLPCPVVVMRDKSDVLSRSKTLNISDGGALIPVVGDTIPEPGSKLEVRFSVPRSTANSYMLEGFSSDARVVRYEPGSEDKPACLAVRFEPSMQLAIEA